MAILSEKVATVHLSVTLPSADLFLLCDYMLIWYTL